MSDRHRKNVQRRIIATIITLIVSLAMITGIAIGAGYLMNNFPFKKGENETATEVATEEASEPVSEALDDSWVVADKEPIEDGYADVDTSILSENEVSENDVSENEVSENTVSDNGSVEYDPEIEEIINSMALEEKVAQLFIVTPESITGVDVVTQAGDTTKEALSEYPVGGIIYNSPNFEDPDQTKEMLQNTKSYIEEYCNITPFLAIDEEGGRVSRIAEIEAFGVKNVGPMADIADEASAYVAGNTIGTYLKELGFNLDFAPVADVNTNNDNTIIGDRSFSSDPDTVSSYSSEFAKGLIDAGITPCYKHFPGHGSTSGDTHTGTVVLSKTYDELLEADLKPFINAINSGMPMIMASHITCENIDASVSEDGTSSGGSLPTSMSPYMLSDILRDRLGFNGLIITDSFAMDAITGICPDPGEAAVISLQAGADIILMPADFHKAYDAVLSAVSSGDKINEERINDSLRRILRVKLNKYTVTDTVAVN